jgi:hypothetical protein
MERSEIAEAICEVLCTGNVADSLANVVTDQSKWALISGAWQEQPLSDSSKSAKYFQGFGGLRAAGDFCRNALQIESGDMTGCVIRGDYLFLFGTIRMQATRTKIPPETNFAGKLIWQGEQVVSGEFRIIWPFPVDSD